MGSAWANTLANRSIMSPGPQVGLSTSASGTALVHYPNNVNNADGQGPPAGMEDAYERPPPKGSAELFNPRSGARKSPASRTSMGPVDKENNRNGIEGEKVRGIDGMVIPIPVLTDKMGGMSMESACAGVGVGDGGPAAVVPPTNGAGGVESSSAIGSS